MIEVDTMVGPETTGWGWPGATGERRAMTVEWSEQQVDIGGSEVHFMKGGVGEPPLILARDDLKGVRDGTVSGSA